MMTGLFTTVWQHYKTYGCEITLDKTIRTECGMDSESPSVYAFIREMESLICDSEVFTMMITIGVQGRFPTPSSFIGLLLRQDALQSHILDYLLEKLSETASEEQIQSTKLILRELRWMDHVLQPKQLVDKLISSLPAFPISVQRDIIYILPEIAGDAEEAMVIDALLGVIRSNVDLTVSCIEALGNFNVLNEQTTQVVECVVERLESSPLVELPVLVKYLVQEPIQANVELIATQLREKLSTTFTFSTSWDGNEEALVLNTLIQGFNYREDLLKAFLTIMSKDNLRLVDLWILLAGHSNPRDQVKMEKLLKKKVISGAVTRSLVIQSIKGHANALKTYFTCCLQVASMLMTQSTIPSCLEISSILYEVLFEEFSHSQDKDRNLALYYQGEIVSSILCHCFSTNGSIDHALALFSTLVSSDVSFRSELHPSEYSIDPIKRHVRFQPFLPAFKQLMDTIDIYSVSQARIVYTLLFRIGGSQETELLTIVHKQLSHQETKYRCCGILGMIARINSILCQYREERSHDEAEMAKMFNRLVLDLRDHCISYAPSVAFMLKELTQWIHPLEVDKYAESILKIVYDGYLDHLSNHFMAEYDLEQHQQGIYQSFVLDHLMKSDLWLGLDWRSSPTYVKILDLAVSPHLHDQMSLCYLSQEVELVLTCARKLKDTKEIEAVLVCPLQLIEQTVLEDLGGLEERVQHIVCLSLWHAINWIRAVLNFFSNENDTYSMLHVVERLKNLVSLESMLLDCILDQCPSFTPPGSRPIVTSKTIEIKKRGRPSTQPLSNRVMSIRQTFLPLEMDVIKILTFSALWNTIHGVNELKNPIFSQAMTMKDPTPESLILFLFQLVRDQTRRDPSCLDSNVLQSCQQYAHYYLTHQQDENKSIIQKYLQIGSFLLEDNDKRRVVETCQYYYLPMKQHKQVNEENRLEVLEKSFQHVFQMNVIVEDDLDAAVSILQALLAILTLVYGYSATKKLEYINTISFQQTVFSNVEMMSNRIGQLALMFLQHDWHPKMGYKSNQLEFILKVYLSHGPVPLDHVQHLIMNGVFEWMEHQITNTSSSSFPTLGKKTLWIYHRAMFDVLLGATTRLDFNHQENDVTLMLNYLMQAVLIFKALVGITKGFQTSSIIATTLKAGRKFIEVIIQAMPFLQAHFATSHREQILTLIVHVQTATRRMQILCAHGKLIRDASAATQVPMVKKILERFIFQGEALARAHGILPAFTTGVLKNKRLDGSTIPREELEQVESEEEKSEEEVEIACNPIRKKTKVDGV